MALDLFPSAYTMPAGKDPAESYRSQRSPAAATKLSIVTKWRFPKVRNWSVKLAILASDLPTFRAFWEAHRGGAAPCDFVLPYLGRYTDLPRGVGDGVETTFDAPVIGGTAPAAYVDGSPVSISSYTPGAGSNGRATVTLASAPAFGSLITLDVVGAQRVRTLVMGDGWRPQERGEVFLVPFVFDEV